MVQFLSIIFFSWISSIFVGVFKISRFFVSPCIYSCNGLTVSHSFLKIFSHKYYLYILLFKFFKVYTLIGTGCVNNFFTFFQHAVLILFAVNFLKKKYEGE